MEVPTGNSTNTLNNFDVSLIVEEHLVELKVIVKSVDGERNLGIETLMAGFSERGTGSKEE